jgi:hypothetical protein
MNDNVDISGLLTWDEGLPRPQWDLVTAWVENCVPLHGRHDAWTTIGRQWLEKLGPALGRRYTLDESEHFLLLAPQQEPSRTVLLRFGEQSRQRLLTSLPGITDFRIPGKLVVLSCQNSDDYYRYISLFYPEGHHGDSGGVQIREGYSHIVLNGQQLENLENSLAHELTHASLSHLGLAQWIEEGLAQMFEHDMTGRAVLLVDAEMAREHKRYWGKHGLDRFWRGNGFSSPGKVQKLSYELAEILLRLLFEEYRARWFGLDQKPRRRLLAFLGEATAADSGEAAARNIWAWGCMI